MTTGTEEPRTPSVTKLDQAGADTAILDKRAVLAGLLLCALLAVLALIWRFAVGSETRRPPEEFQFSVAEHNVEDFKLTQPVRDVVKEIVETLPEAKTQVEERPNIQISQNPVEVPVTQEIVQSNNIAVETPKIDVSATQMEIQDAPADISLVTETVNYAVQPIAADTQSAADIFKYKDPTPRDKMAVFTMNSAPRPGRDVKVMAKAFGDQKAPTIGKLGPANINLFGSGDFSRTMEASGGVKARTAVDAALHWLAVHQDGDGSWKAEKFEGQPGGDLADTALSALAFMGGGNTIRKGEYRRNVLKALEAIMRQQKPDGLITAGGDNLYTHAICTIALCEAHGRARDERIGAAAQKAIDYCASAVNADGGWRYKPQSPMSDFSVTAWFQQALKTAKLGQVKFESALSSRALAYLDSVTDSGASKESSGAVSYLMNPDRTFDRGSPALTAAGMLIRQVNGTGVKNHLLVKGAELTRQRPPRWDAKNFYEWYYATYAMHNMGGEYRIWWNQRMRDVLVEHQSREGDLAGSWDPKGDNWAATGGRVYTTALGALCLEVYYRYSEALNSFGVAPDLDELFFQ